MHNGACALGRLVATCRYMELPETQERLKVSIRAMDAVMAKVDGDASIPKPGGMSYVAAHKAWFTSMYAAGIKKLQEQYVDAAVYLKDPARAAEYAALPQLIRDKVDILAGPNGGTEAESLCGGGFVYP